MTEVELWTGFSAYDKARPGRHSDLKHICLALRRRGIETMEQLAEIYALIPDELQQIRGIGPGRLALLEEVLRAYRTMAPPGL